ncbi:OLC1v1010437C2 [Oldenlandia corymbosa var. corymbosa]|uniref:Acyl carrier protein n=1 Tax=Oldenlandia corymbosa var. corymbosa TaxID=529605 RepID=A0AAV1DRA5_OLDCO|nr:OLC1v1010437C2 [Oldenlandia corymbosa var. corymbosa]
MASSILVSASSATFIRNAPPRAQFPLAGRATFSNIVGSSVGVGGLKSEPGIQILKKAAAGTSKASSPNRRGFKSRISCITAEPETLKIVQETIAYQLSVDVSKVTPETTFAELGVDSLHTVAILLAVEEKFRVQIGGSNIENVKTIQDAADLIEQAKIKTARLIAFNKAKAKAAAAAAAAEKQKEIEMDDDAKEND